MTMFKRVLSLALWILSLATIAQAQQSAEAELFTRVEGQEVRAAIAISIDPGSHLYHGPTEADLGHPQAIGTPTTVTFLGEGVAWSEVRYPEPFQYPQLDEGPGVFINSHEGDIVLYAAGSLAEGASVDELKAKLRGLVCDHRGCMPWNRTVTNAGAGEDDVWEAWPEDLAAPAPPAPLVEEEEFVAREDELVSGSADATVYTRRVEDDPTKLRAAILVDLEDGNHIYYRDKGNEDGIGLPTSLTLTAEGVTWGEARWPEPEKLDQSDIEEGAWIWGYEHDFVLYVEGTLEPGANGFDTQASFRGQTCDANGCITYEEVAYTQGEGPDDVWADWNATSAAHARFLKRAEAEAAAGTEGGGEGEEKPLAPFLLEAMLWGLITLLMPCTYPMIPITISFFTKQAEARGGKVLPLSLAYGLGIVLIFALIGVLVGPAIVPFAQGGVLNLIIGLFFFYFALVLLGYVNLQPPKFLMQAAGKASTKGGFLGVFLMGACLVVTSFTCTAPFVGTLLARGASGGDVVRVILGMSVFGLTMAIPFVVLSLVPGKIQALPKSGAWMNTLKVTLGFVELAAAFKFLSNADLAWGWNVLSREVFLALWALIFVLAGLYLFGVLVLKGNKESIGGARRFTSVLFLGFGVYCGWGLVGNKMDWLMETMNPPYSHGLYDFGGDWVMVVDDLDQAIAQAKEEDKLVFINFTGHT